MKKFFDIIIDVLIGSILMVLYSTMRLGVGVGGYSTIIEALSLNEMETIILAVFLLVSSIIGELRDKKEYLQTLVELSGFYALTSSVLGIMTTYLFDPFVILLLGIQIFVAMFYETK